MIRFFRQLRLAALNSPKLGKYLSYAVGEIFLVVIGILIALQVNNWNETLKGEKLSFETIKNLKNELENARTELRGQLDINRDIIKNSARYLDNTLSLDTLNEKPEMVLRFITYGSINLDLPIFQQEISSERKISGHSNLMENLYQIKSKLAPLLQASTVVDDFWQEESIPFLMNSQNAVLLHQWLSGKKLSFTEVKPLYEDKAYKNLVSISWLYTLGIITKAEDLLKEIDETLLIMTSNDK